MLEPRRSASGSAKGMLSRDRTLPRVRRRRGRVRVRRGLASCVLLKRLPDAQRDGDRILAVIRGTAANQDGHTVNIVTPSADAQVAAYRAALAAADVDPATVGMVEAHGTGTPVGDPIEYASLAAGLRHRRPVRARLGEDQFRPHPVGRRRAGADEGGPGPAARRGPAESALQRHARRDGRDRDQTLCAARGHAVADWRRRRPAAGGGVVVRHVRHQRARHRRAGPAAQRVTAAEPRRQQPRRTRPGVPAVVQLGRRTAPKPRGGWPTGSTAQADLAICRSGLHAGPPARAPAGAHRRAGQHRHRAVRAHCARSPTARCPFPAAVGQDDRGPVWVFSGQGSQWAAMGADLLANEPVFAATIAEIEPLIAEESGFSVTEAMTAPENRDRHRPGAADPVRHAGRAGGHHEGLRGPARARSSATRWVSPRRRWSPARCRWKTACR